MSTFISEVSRKKITREDVEEVLVRVESGETTVADANLLRAYFRMLCSWIETEVPYEVLEAS